ncbi:bombyxin B-8 precursor [Bombyx mori]|uniref:Bombyxin B-8 n=1 Tax=Bombyx mori TaxID=7091 RepID=BXB8_BOMMO|nr:bombyxin B-8 precursor [Bombyx mori]P26742.1 RecName: Full=Bombyxin B-8; Short=BBX-B8; AltName: Full=4K-prothoracicotropic hormone; Short=4K-PTTH; Contains: RecName: Full=Bombyxin B-8 B chain; Contains: RecName: Full=Bombyxin B-8 A chain; Flags: Precursor [Bombyx mori]BAA00680.1 bombyxin B-8 precursor [Bombyx mori]
MKTSVIFVLIVLNLMWSGEAQEVARTYCGSHLADTLADLCFGVVKRGGAQYAPYFWQKAYLGSRGKRGVVDECCFRPCTLDVLASYCG